jgi:hypothetical protein
MLVESQGLPLHLELADLPAMLVADIDFAVLEPPSYHLAQDIHADTAVGVAASLHQTLQAAHAEA